MRTWLLLLAPAMLLAGDFWIDKPFTEWSVKEAQKMVSNSPWAKQVSVSMGPMPGNFQGGGGGRGGGRSRGGGGGMSTGMDAGATGGGNPTGGAGGSGGGGADSFGGAGLDSGGGGGGGAPSISVLVRWQTALPVKQALLKIRYGAEAASSAEAKKFLETADNNYVIAVEGLPAMGVGMGRGGQQHGGAAPDPSKMVEMLKAATALHRKGKDPIQAVNVQFGQQQGQTRSAYFVFPRTEIEEADKEIEFKTKVGSAELKHKFKLKDMMIGGKLAI